MKAKKQLFLGVSLLILFIAYTVSLRFIDIKPIGPNGSLVAFSTINKAIHNLLGVNMTLYNITDWAGVVAIFIAFGFAILGLVQWIKRKTIFKVDAEIILLGVFYIVVFWVYAFFEFIVINHRPILINGFLEASYPSSTTMLATCVMPTAIMQFNERVESRRIRKFAVWGMRAFTVFMVAGRLVCGVHWFTDIIGGLIFSSAMVLLYCSANSFIKAKAL